MHINTGYGVHTQNEKQHNDEEQRKLRLPFCHITWRFFFSNTAL